MKGVAISEAIKVSGFFLVAIVLLFVIMHAITASVSYESQELTEISAKRLSRALELVASYQGEAAILLKYEVPYQIQITEPWVRFDYADFSASRSFSVPYRVSLVASSWSTTDLENKNFIICLSKVNQDGNWEIVVDLGEDCEIF